MKMPFRRLVLLAPVLLALPLAAQAQSQTGDNRYGSWAPPGAVGNGQAAQNMSGLLKELNALIKDAEKSRAANPVFLGDLKALSARYDNPWTQRLLFDDFSDGDFQRNPVWSVTSGEFWVEQGYGLRSRVVEAAAGDPAASGQQQPLSKEQMVFSVLGAVLQGAAKNGGGTVTTTPAAAPAKPSMIESRARISNAFMAVVELSSWKADGAFEVGVTQGLNGAGYRVVYNAGQNPRLELVRVTARGRGVVDTKSLTALEDQKVHTLTWTRQTDGTMAISMDGTAVLSARDASFRDPFDALQLSSQGADVIVKSVALSGMR